MRRASPKSSACPACSFRPMRAWARRAGRVGEGMGRGGLRGLAELAPAGVNRLLAEMRAEAEAVVRRGAPDSALTEQRSAFMRYRGQGHEISVALPVRAFTAADRATIA